MVVLLGKRFQAEVKQYSDAALKALFENFIEPIRNSVELSDLPGKYKPSWAVPDFGTTMQQAFKQISEDKNLYHYHIGFKFYRQGTDPDYPGKESDGIVHTMILAPEKEGDWTRHVVLRLDESHPSPFSIPWDFDF